MPSTPNAIQATPDYIRVRDLPRRVLDVRVAESFARELTPRFRRPGSSATLRPWQAQCLHEVATVRGLVAWLPVGQGKTLVSELIPAACGMAGLPAVLFVKGRTLADKAFHERRELRADWILPDPPPAVVTIESMARESASDWFDRVRPRVIIVDEADDTANVGAAFMRRLTRYLMQAEERGEEVIVVFLTGTPTRSSIMTFWHHLVLALGMGAPMPMTEPEAADWASVIDEFGATASPRAGYKARLPLGPGVLGVTHEAARAWFAQRLRETPGLVRVDEDSAPGVPLTVRQMYAREDAKLDAAYETFLKSGELPGGAEIVTDPLSRYRIDAQLGTGFYMRFRDPQPPDAWKEARSLAAKFVRFAIEESTHTADPIDTEAQVYRRHADAWQLQEWIAIEPTYTPHPEVHWLSTATIQTAVAWLAEGDRPEVRAKYGPSIVWCGSREFLAALRTATGLFAYGAQGRDIVQKERSILSADRARSLIASWHANKKGLNLQPWGRMLITHPPPSAKWLEQIIGRGHRAGRTQGVHVDVLMGSGGTCDLFDRVFQEARFAQEIALTQKILRANIVREKPPPLTPGNSFRWARGGSGD